PGVDAIDDYADSDGGEPVAVHVLENDESDGQPLTVDSFDNPAHGTVTFDSNGVATYTPGSDYIGLDSFHYTITDGLGNFDTAIVSIGKTTCGCGASGCVSPGDDNLEAIYANEQGNGGDTS